MTYLDNAATTFPKPECVYREMDDISRNYAVNAGRGSYKAAQKAVKVIDDTRAALLKLFNAEGIADVVLTASVTQALNIVLAGLGLKEGSMVYISPYEHNAVVRTLHMLQKEAGFTVKEMPLTKGLEIDLGRLEFEFAQNHPSVVVSTAVSNVTGYVLPIGDIFQSAKKYDAVTITDAAQAAGLIKMDVRDLKADILCFAGHKTLYGPFGIAGFVMKKDVELKQTFAGGTGSHSLSPEMPQNAPERFEAGSCNIVAVKGLYAALGALEQEEHYRKIKEITEYAINALEVVPGISILGRTKGQLGIISFVADGYSSDEIGKILDEEYDIAVRTGYHCAPLIHKHLKDEPYEGTVRIGLGYFNTEENIDKLAEALISL
ncbi:MAG: aminotransferase class V-fold PLP-dependent enzyme [Lachnospiraceae bacterium]|nr:aminotransferase class V-fold PLP-dependent enzyme [Lachnospiraceae bacterium]